LRSKNTKTVVVFGATGSIGRVITGKLLAEGFDVIAVARDQHKLSKLRELFSVRRPTMVGRSIDVTRRSDVDYLQDLIDQKGVQIWAVVYAVGNFPAGGFTREISTPISGVHGKELEELFALYPVGFQNVAQRMLLVMEEGGHIVALSSAMSRFANTPGEPWSRWHLSHHAAAFAALDRIISGYGRARTAATEKKVLVHRIAPAAVRTHFYDGAPPELLPPSGFTTPEAVAREVLSALRGTEAVDTVVMPEQAGDR